MREAVRKYNIYIKPKAYKLDLLGELVVKHLENITSVSNFLKHVKQILDIISSEDILEHL